MANFFPTPFLLLLLLSNPLALEAATESSLIASIDCGASNGYTDKQGIPWTSDSSLIKTGKAETVPNATSFSQAMQTLRVFTTGISNCYNISIPISRVQVLVRATFFYGNYDGNISPPTFDLEFDGNSWSTVQTTVDTLISEEAIYVASGGSTSICLVQTKTGQSPFISSLEVRGLGDSMYSQYDRSSSALVLSLRTALGSAAPVRYPDDPYDRIWILLDFPKSIDIVQNVASSVNTSTSEAPPEAIFKSAITPAAGANILIFTTPLPSNGATAYINMYFTEVRQLAAGEKRAIQIFVNRTAVSFPFIPSFGGVDEFYMSNFSASNSTQIQLQPAENATLSPVISGLEVFVIIPLSGSGGGATEGPGGAVEGPSGAAEGPGGTAEGPRSAAAGPSLPAVLGGVDVTLVSESPSVSDGPPGGDASTEPSDTSTVPSNESPSDTSSTENGSPTAESDPKESSSGVGKKENPSFGNKVKVGRFVGIGVGFVVPILFSNFV